AKEKLRAIFVNHMAHLSFSSEEERRVHIHKNFPCFSPQGVSNESFLLYPDALFQTTQEGTFIPNTDSGIFNIQEPRDFEPYWEDLAKVQCPVLLLIGGRGSLLETDAIERFLRLSSHFRSETIPGARHSIHLDQPRAFAAATLQFIDTDCSD
ncbi:MAG: alpha/beta hydrolase, partial [Bdellovibrionales bacterium]|nr:alpha/beta hydrolase [Bdellovibrionales bacterium]